MKLISKLMLQWVLVYGLITIGVVLLDMDWAPLMDAYHDMSARQTAIYAIMAMLIVAWVFIIWHDSKEIRAQNRALAKSKVLRPKAKPRQLELRYPNVLGEDHMHIPVMSVLQAEDLIKLLKINKAEVGYRNKDTGEFHAIYLIGQLVTP